LVEKLWRKFGAWVGDAFFGRGGAVLSGKPDQERVKTEGPGRGRERVKRGKKREKLRSGNHSVCKG